MNGPFEHEEAKDLVRDYVCGECGASLSNPWGGYYGIDGVVVRCVKDKDHQGIRRPGRQTKRVYDIKEGWKEYDMMTQKPVNETQALALPNDERGMRSRVSEAMNVGLFPNREVTNEQLNNLTKLALLYRLDPLMGEIMPYQGQPFITLQGRRRIDDRAGHHPTIKMGPMDQETYNAYVAMGAINQGDIVVVGQFTDPKSGATIETVGRVLASERNGNPHLPIVKWPLEMAMKRCEARGRKSLWGPVALPGGLEAIYLREEDDVVEAVVVNVSAPEREIAEPPQVEPDPPVEVPPDDEPLGPPDDEPANGLTYGDVLDRAGAYGLDDSAFQVRVLGCTLEEFRARKGASPQVADRRLTEYLDKQDAGAL